jgi:hypothetical protein
MAEYWIAEDCPSGYPILEVFDGGWAKEEDKCLGYTRQQREWIIVTAVPASAFSRSTNPRLVTQSGLLRLSHRQEVTAFNRQVFCHPFVCPLRVRPTSSLSTSA